MALIKRLNELWRSDSREAALELLDEDVIVDASRRVSNPSTYRGREGVLELLAETEENWEVFETFPDTYLAVGDAAVVVSGTYEARNRADGVELSDTYAEIWTVDEGRVIHWDLPYANQEEAITAVREAGPGLG